MNTKHTWGKRLAAATGVAALVVTGLAGAAFAEDEDTTPDEEVVTTAASSSDLGVVHTNLDTTQAVSVTIQKHKGDETSVRSDGTEKVVAAEKLGGVRFGLTPILCKKKTEQDTAYAQVDLKTDEGWLRANDVKLTDDKSDITMKESSLYSCKKGTEVLTDPTDATSGRTTYDGTWTLYYVREAQAPSNTVITRTADPFLLTLPLAYTGSATTQGGWIYDPIVYPKNSTKTATNSKSGKVVDGGTAKDIVLADGGAGSLSGDRLVEWTIVVTVPARAKYTSFWVDDPLNAALSYDKEKGAGVTIESIEDATGSNVADKRGTMVAALNCTIGAAQSWTCNSAATKTSRNIRLNVTPAANLKAGDKITMKLRTVIDPAQITATNPSATNDAAKAYVNNETDPSSGSTPLKPPTTDCEGCSAAQNYGFAKLKKIDANNSTQTEPKGLKDAHFKLYTVVPTDDPRTQVDTSTLPEALRGKVGEGQKLVLLPSGRTNASDETQNGTYVTNAEGVIDLKLLLGNNGDKDAVFFLQETKAPLGYVTPAPASAAAWAKVEFSGGTLNTDDATALAKFSNTKSTASVIPGGLPLTGAQGLMLLTLGGGALILVGIGIMMVIRRRQAEDA